MKTFDFVADFCGTVYGSIEADSIEGAREKLQENLGLSPSLKCDQNADMDSTWDFKPKCHGNCCSFGGSTDDEYGIDITEEEE